jgi:uroporphyrinogen decarboxylase
MDHRLRLETVLAGAKPDRVPVALWRHFPVDDQEPGSLAGATLDFQHSYDFDLVKVTPASSFCIKDWGVQDEWRGATEGTREYTVRAIHKPEDWEKLPALDPHKTRLGWQLECLRLITSQLGERTPVIQTIFSPLAQAKNLVGGTNLLVHIRRYPDALHQGLKTICESTRRFIEAARQTGIAGIFYAVQHAQYHWLSREEYQAFGSYYDRQILETTRDLWLNMLHLHGENVMFDRFLDYPVQILNWHDQDTYPDLAEGQNLFSGVVCGGLKREKTLVLGSPQDVINEARQAIDATGGQRFILGTGCVAPIIAPRANLLAARQAVEGNL